MVDNEIGNAKIREFAKNNIEDIENGNSIGRDGRCFGVNIFEEGTNKSLGRYKACCSKMKSDTSYILECEKENKGTDSSIEYFRIEPRDIVVERSSNNELAFKKGVKVLIVKH